VLGKCNANNISNRGHLNRVPVANTGVRCYDSSILEIWSYNKDVIEKLTDAEILDAILSTTVR
jgi:hypothetical protein